MLSTETIIYLPAGNDFSSYINFIVTLSLITQMILAKSDLSDAPSEYDCDPHIPDIYLYSCHALWVRLLYIYLYSKLRRVTRCDLKGLLEMSVLYYYTILMGLIPFS